MGRLFQTPNPATFAMSFFISLSLSKSLSLSHTSSSSSISTPSLLLIPSWVNPDTRPVVQLHFLILAASGVYQGPREKSPENFRLPLPACILIESIKTQKPSTVPKQSTIGNGGGGGVKATPPLPEPANSLLVCSLVTLLLSCHKGHQGCRG